MDALIGVAIVSCLLGFFVFLFRLAKRQRARLAEALAQAGYQAVPHLDSGLAQTFEALTRGRGKSGPVKNVYRYSGLHYDLYRLDVPGGESDQTRYAMDFRQPIFPPFAILPQFKLPGFLSGVVNKLLAMTVSGMDLKEVEVPGKPRFRERYRLFGAQAHDLLSAIPADVWDRLADLQGHVCLQGRDRLLVLMTMVQPNQRSAMSPAVDVRKMVETADQLWHIFSVVRPQRQRV